MRTTLLLANALALTIVLQARTLEAQCGPYETCIGENDHKVSCPGGPSEVQNCHSTCQTCITGDCHPPCAFALRDIRSNNTYLRLLELATVQDIDGLTAAADSSGGRVFFNPKRDASQLVGCDGISVVANLPIGSAVQRVLAAARIPDASQLGASGPRWAMLQPSVGFRNLFAEVPALASTRAPGVDDARALRLEGVRPVGMP